PQNIISKIEETTENLPEGLVDYFYRNDWPDWTIAANLSRGVMLGVYMRWYAALKGIQRYYETPLSLRFLGVEMFCEHVRNAIESTSFLEAITDFNSAVQDPLRMKETKTIFPFFTKLNGEALLKAEV